MHKKSHQYCETSIACVLIQVTVWVFSEIYNLLTWILKGKKKIQMNNLNKQYSIIQFLKYLQYKWPL